jgi:GT2 family glycosyltransferase
VGDLAVIIFSKDRPLQLDATIRSLLAFCDDVEPADLKVLHVASAPAYAAGYRILANEHPGVVLRRETDFKADLLGLVNGSTYVLFIVDDTLFVGPLSFSRATRVLDEDAACLGFSFRLGRNTTYCYTLDGAQALPVFDELASGVLSFAWTGAEHDFGYPLELSSSLYRTSDILPLLAELAYRNPNTLESVLAQHAASFRMTRPRLACYAQSVALSVPANLVQTVWKNRVDGNRALTAEALADAYARGRRLDVEHYRGFVTNACHQELEFFFAGRPDVPTVSVVIPCYGQAEYLPEAVASVVGQTFADWELTIVDDGSPDETAAVAADLIARHPSHRIRLIRQANRGLAPARNAGIEASKGRYLLPLDADDMLAPSFLERTVALLEASPSLAIAYTDHERFGESTATVANPEFSAFLVPATNLLNYCSLFRREVWEAVGGYNPNMKLGYEDWDFWVGAVERGYRGARIPEPLLRYRIRSGSMITTAVQHDADLRRQMRANHPRLYRPWLRMARFTVRVARRLRRLAGRLSRRLRSAGSP